MNELNKLNNLVTAITVDIDDIIDTYELDNVFLEESIILLTRQYLGEITILNGQLTNRLRINYKSKTIRLNNNFDCIYKDANSLEYVKSLL